MAKLALSLESLKVESFVINREATRQGTVRAHEFPTDFNECGMSNPCTTDGQATIDAQLCAQTICSGCSNEGTIGATTCRNTGICCGYSIDRTLYCCQNSIGC